MAVCTIIIVLQTGQLECSMYNIVLYMWQATTYFILPTVKENEMLELGQNVVGTLFYMHTFTTDHTHNSSPVMKRKKY